MFEAGCTRPLGSVFRYHITLSVFRLWALVGLHGRRTVLFILGNLSTCGCRTAVVGYGVFGAVLVTAY